MLRADAVAHHGASYSRNDVEAWTPRRYSADSAILPDLPVLTARADDIIRNNGIARAGLQTLVDNVCGTGFRLSARPDYRALGKSKEWAEKWSAEVETLWSEYFWSTACHAGDSLTGDQITAQMFRGALAKGDAVALPLWLPGRGGAATKIQTIDADRLSQPDGRPPSISLRGGIEFDTYGAPIAYHIRKTHPGDALLNPMALVPMWERIPRRTTFGRLRVIHVFDNEYADQSRGKPLLSAVLPQFKNLDRYQQAELQAAVVNACIALLLETPVPPEEIGAWFENPAERKAYLELRAQHAVRLNSGSVMSLFPGDKATPFTPSRPATAFEPFVTALHRLIGVGGFDLPVELFMKDFSKTNYSSARAAILEAWRSFFRRRDWLATTWLDPFYALWFEEKVNEGTIEAPDFYARPHAFLRCRWVGPGRGWVDPVKEATAAKIRMEIGISTLEDECADQGRDWREVQEQRAVEKAELKRLDLDQTPTDVTQAAARGIGQRDDEDDEDESTSENEDRPRRGGAGSAGAQPSSASSSV